MKVSINLHIIFLAVIAIWTTLIYSNSLDNGFHFDDLSDIKESSHVRSFDDAWSAGMRRVVVITFYINYALGGFDVRYYHVVNIAFHIINAFLIYFLTLVTLRRIDSDSKYILFATPLIFALHPLNTEPINYIVQRTIIICTTFYILSILLFSLSFPLNSKKIGIIRTALCWAGCLFSLTLCIFSKEVSITLPLMLILYYVYFISANIKWFLRWFPLFLLLVIVVTIIASSMGIFESAVKQISHVDPLKHIFINLVAQANVAVEYLGIALLPLPSFLNVDHDVRWTDDFLNIQTLFSVSIILLL